MMHPAVSLQQSHSLLQELTQDLENDTTKPSTSNVKVSQPLTKDGVNLRPWLYDFINCAITKECIEALQKPLPRTRANSAAIHLLISSTPSEFSWYLASCGSAYAALQWIISKYEGGHDRSINSEWFRRLAEEGMTREETLDQYVLRKTTLYHNLLANHHPLHPDDLTKYVIDGLPAEFGPGKASLYAPCAGGDPDTILRILRLYAHGISFNDMQPRSAPKVAKTTTVPVKDNENGGKGRGRPRCWECGKYGHLAKDCKKWEDDEGEQTRKPKHVPVKQSFSGQFHVTHNVFSENVAHVQSEEWLIDSGASVHLTNDISLLQNVTIFAEARPLQLATAAAQGSIIGMGSVCLLNSEGRAAWIHNVQCVPDASSNLLSVSAAVRDGLNFVPKENGTYASVHGPDGWHCSVTERHGLFVMRGVYPTLQPVVCQSCLRVPVVEPEIPKRKHDCKLRQLWHERLGHPGKTASERLSREHLCRGIPVSLIPCTQCDTHCDACVRGKQIKPPFPDSSSSPTGILHRVHADTVGELPRTGTGGERYFLTVVEEFSSYCNIIPVKQKSAIAQELIHVIAKWERQRDAKVKVVRTDRGTEFLNKTFHSHCAENGIHTEMSAAYTPQQNGTAERMNRTIKEKARTLLLGVDADEGLWDEAVKSAAYLHNVMPTSGKDRTPYELFHGVAPDVSGLKKWGCLAYVKREKHQTSTLGAQSVAGMFVGYDSHTKGYRVRIGDKVMVSRNVHFVEGKSGAVAIGRALRQPEISRAVEERAPVEEICEEEKDDDTSSLPVATINPFQPLVDLDNSDAEDETTSPSSSPIAGQRFSTAPDQLSTLPPSSSLPSLEEQQQLPQVVDKTWMAAREVDAAPTPSSGTRARSRQVLKFLMGHPIKLQVQKGAGKNKRKEAESHPVLSREERLRQRNAKKEALVVIDEEEVVPQVAETDKHEDAAVEEGETEMLCEGEACTQHPPTIELSDMSNENVESGEEVTSMHVDMFESPRICRAHSESNKEAHLRGRDGGSRCQGKAGYFDDFSSEEEVVRDEKDELIPTASLAFLRACLSSTSVKFCKVPIPANYREARRSDQWEYWETAMNEEKDSLDAHDCFEYVDRERGKKVIPVHWIYSAKVDEHGNVIRYKARLVAQGCRQIPGVDVDEVFAPTSSFGARRVLLAKAAQEDLEVHQVDIKTAFLNGDLEEEVYVTQPPGFENGGPQVCRLRKALYGLKQAPRAWYKTLDGILEKHGFRSCMSDAGIYVSTDTNMDPMYLVVFVDDMLIMCKCLERVVGFKEALGKEFAIHDLGEVKDFLGCQIVRDREKRVIYMSSKSKIDALVEKFGLSGDTRPVEAPMSKSFLHTARTCESEEGPGAGVPLEPGHRYCELIGSLLYLANTTRPDIAQAVGVLSRYRGTPTTAHMHEALRVLRYLKETRDHTLQLGGSNTVLEGFVDADYGGDLDTRASTTGFLFKVYGGAVVWGSKKQSATACSTVEAEFRAASHAVKEALWLRGLLEELHFDVWKIPLYCDNTGCIQNLKNPVNSKYTKHVAVSFHHARSAVIQGQVDVKYISTQANVADIFTKPLVPVLFKQHRETLGLIERS